MQGCKLLSDIGQRPTKFRKNPITFDRTLVRRKIDLVIHTEIGKYTLKEGLQSVLRIGSAHNKGGPPNINVVQISYFSNSF